jgi:hypothetical protein
MERALQASSTVITISLAVTIFPPLPIDTVPDGEYHLYRLSIAHFRDGTQQGTYTVTQVHQQYGIDGEWVTALGIPEQGADGEVKLVVKVDHWYDPLQHPEVLDELLNVDDGESALAFVRVWGFLGSVGTFSTPGAPVYREKIDDIVKEAERAACVLDLVASAAEGKVAEALDRHKGLPLVRGMLEKGPGSAADALITHLLERGLKGMGYGLNPGKLRLEPRPVNLLGAVWWHLYQSILGGHELKVCPCGRGFVVRHGNQDYCTPRHAALYRKKEQRRREKGETHARKRDKKGS